MNANSVPTRNTLRTAHKIYPNQYYKSFVNLPAYDEWEQLLCMVCMECSTTIRKCDMNQSKSATRRRGGQDRMSHYGVGSCCREEQKGSTSIERVSIFIFKEMNGRELVMAMIVDDECEIIGSNRHKR